MEAFFLDQEAEYAGTISVIETMMSHPLVVPRWFQVPLRMTNATSHAVQWMHAWGPGETWMRHKDANAIHDAPGAPDRFYDFFPWYERQHERTAFLVGLRSRESLNRWRAVTKNAGFMQADGTIPRPRALHAQSARPTPGSAALPAAKT